MKKAGDTSKRKTRQEKIFREVTGLFADSGLDKAAAIAAAKKLPMWEKDLNMTPREIGLRAQSIKRLKA